MMSDDDDFAYQTTNQSSKNLATLFHGGEPPPAGTTAYVPPKQPKKESAPRVMIATVVQTFSFGADQKWTPKGKMGVALLSTDNTVFQLIIYLSKTQQITSVRINTSSVFTPQSNNYLSFQDDNNQNWSIMFDTKQAIVDFALQIVLAKAFLLSLKFEHVIQDIREGEGSVLADHDSAEVSVNTYKILENGSLQANDPGENKPVRYKIGKNQNGKAFDDVLRGMKKGGQRVAMVAATLYSIEIVRIKREKEARSSSISMQAEEQLPVEQKRPAPEETEQEKEKNKLLQRINRMGGVSMIHNPNQSSAFVTSHHLSDDDSITNEYIQHIGTPRAIATPVQFVQAGYHHPLPLIQQANLYAQQQQQQQQLQDYMTRPGPGMTGLPYQQVSMWPPTQYPPTTPNIPPTDMFYQQQQQQLQQPPPPPPADFRQLLTRLNEKVDVLNDKFDSKISTTHSNMETSSVLSSIQRIVKENENMKKDLYDRSAKIEELNSKISELLDRNQRLIEQSHNTAEQRNNVVNNVSEQTAQKILDLEKQKLELTTNLSISTSKIADLQLQLNQFTQDTNENQSRASSLAHKCEQYKDDLQKSETQRLELQTKFDTIHEQYKSDKVNKKQLQIQVNTLEEELAELKITCAAFEKVINERKNKIENERKRWQDDLDEQKQIYEKELDELRTKLRKQRTNESLNNNQEDLEKEWQEKFDRQQTQHERVLNSKTKELEQLKTSLEQNETKLLETIAELDESKENIEAYEERCEKLQERLAALKEKLIEMNDEQPQLVNEQVKQAINIIFQRLKTRIQPTKQYTGEQFLSRSLEVIKKATLKVLSNDEDEGESSSPDEVQSEDENEEHDQPINGNSVDQQTLHEEVSSVQTEEPKSEELSTTNNPKNGWDTVDDFQPESKTSTEPIEQNQAVVIVTEESTTTVIESEPVSNPIIENKETVSTEIEVAEQHESDADTIEDNDEKPPPVLPVIEKLPEKTASDDDDDALFQSARPSIQSNDPSPSPPPTQSLAAPKNKSNKKNPLMTDLDESDDELFK